MTTENAASTLTDSIFDYTNFRNHVEAIVCDLAKVFHCVNYQIF
jgi:hypothetical protein